MENDARKKSCRVTARRGFCQAWFTMGDHHARRCIGTQVDSYKTAHECAMDHTLKVSWIEFQVFAAEDVGRITDQDIAAPFDIDRFCYEPVDA